MKFYYPSKVDLLKVGVALQKVQVRLREEFGFADGWVWYLKFIENGGFHSHVGTPKWMVCKGKSHSNGWWLGVPPFQETSKYLQEIKHDIGQPPHLVHIFPSRFSPHFWNGDFGEQVACFCCRLTTPFQKITNKNAKLENRQQTCDKTIWDLIFRHKVTVWWCPCEDFFSRLLCWNPQGSVLLGGKPPMDGLVFTIWCRDYIPTLG